jgi:hypothetical protein
MLYFMFRILTIPYMLSPINYYYIRYTSPPKAYRRRKGDLSVNYYYTNKRAGYIMLWVSFIPRP